MPKRTVLVNDKPVIEGATLREANTVARAYGGLGKVEIVDTPKPNPLLKLDFDQLAELSPNHSGGLRTLHNGDALLYAEDDMLIGEAHLRKHLPQGCTVLAVKRYDSKHYDFYVVTDEWGTPTRTQPFYISKLVACALHRKVWDSQKKAGVELLYEEHNGLAVIETLSRLIHGDSHSLRGWEV